MPNAARATVSNAANTTTTTRIDSPDYKPSRLGYSLTFAGASPVIGTLRRFALAGMGMDSVSSFAPAAIHVAIDKAVQFRFAHRGPHDALI